MARANAANGSLRAKTIMGVARTTAYPLQQRIEHIEPFLKLAIPVLVGIFAVLFALAGTMLLNATRQDRVDDAMTDMDMIASLAQRDIAARAVEISTAPTQQTLSTILHERVTAEGRRILLTNAAGAIMLSIPPVDGSASDLLQVLGGAQHLTILGDRAGVAVIPAQGGSLIATVRSLPEPLGQMAVLQPLNRALYRTDQRNNTIMMLLAGSLVVLSLLTWAFLIQTRRARAADVDCERIRERLDTALNSGRCGLWDWDLAKGRIYWSDSMYALLGYAREGDFLSFGRVNALIHPEDTDFYEIARALSAGEETSIALDFRVRSAEGQWLWMRARAELLNDRTTGTKHLVGIAVDITEERRVAAESAIARTRLWDAIETVPEAFVLWDHKQRLVTCNRKFQTLHNLPEHAIQPGLLHADVMRHATPPVIAEDIIRERNLENQSRISEVKLEDGRWLQISERRTKDGGSVSIGTDITIIKNHEEKLMEGEQKLMATIADLKLSRRQLEAQAQQLSELAERYLEEKDKAELASRAKTQFLANMSHDLRTPLNAIIGFSDIMESGMFGSLGCERHVAYCRDIKASGEHLLEIVDDILEMSQLETGKVAIAPTRLAISDLVEAAIAPHRAMMEMKQLALHIDIEDGIAAYVDPLAMRQVVGNLVCNAVKFTPDAGRIWVRARACSRMVHVYVSDTGIGIPATQLVKIGRPFEQVEGGETARSHKGSGLGLAIARGLCALHGGSLRLRSQEGSGTVALARMPLAAASTIN